MFRYKLIFFVFCFLFCAVSQAAVTARLDKPEIAEGDIVTLSISTHDHIKMTPDLTPLNRDFHILGTSRNAQLSVFNGSADMTSEWQVALQPKRAGQLQIPAIKVGGESTTPLSLNVVSVTPQSNKGASGKIFMEASVSPKEAFVQEQFIYTLKVYFAESIVNGQLNPPALENSKIAPNGQDINYSSTRQGRYFRVIERSYLITPQKPGRFQITPATLKAYVEKNVASMDPYDMMGSTVRAVTVVGPSIFIEVKPKPSSFKGAWLPAKDVTINEAWEADPLVFKVGEPVTRVITIVAKGVTASQIPVPIISNQPGYNTYPSHPVYETDTAEASPIGSLKQRVAYIPTHSGKMVLAPITIRWWNTRTQHEAVATLPGKTIHVLPAAKSAPLSTPPPTQAVTAVPLSKTSPPISRAKNSNFWPILALVALLAWMMTMGLWFWYSRRNRQEKIPLVDQVQAACMQNDAATVRKAILAWATRFWPKHVTHSLCDIAKILEIEKATAWLNEIMLLEKAFHGSSTASWQGHSFWEAFNDYLALHHSTHVKSKPEDPLPSLYGSDGNQS